MTPPQIVEVGSPEWFAMVEQQEKRTAERLRGRGPGGTSGGVTDDWKADVERRLGQLHSDVRALLNRGVIAIVGLAGLIAGLYLYTNAKFDGVGQRFDGINQHLTTIEVQQAKADAKLDLLIERTAPRA